MRKQQRQIKEVLFIFLIIIIIGLFFFANLEYTRSNPGGNDFLVHWVGTKTFVQEEISPYSDDVALDIQNLVYGRPARNGEHELRVAYPFYSIFLFLPFSLIEDYSLARAAWMTILELSIIFSTILTLKVINWKPRLLMTILLIVFGLFWYHALRSIINGNAVVIILFTITLVFYGIKYQLDELVGISMALMTIKPQVVLIFLIFIIFWALTNKRSKIIFWFLGTFLLLVMISLFILPSWPIEFLREVFRYPSYNPPGTPATALAVLLPGIGRQLGIIISAVSAFALLTEWVLGKQNKDLSFNWVGCLTLVLSQWVNIQTDPGNFLIMFPAILLTFKVIERRWNNVGQWVNIGLLAILFFIPWIIFINSINYDYQPIQNPIMFFPVPIIIVIVLYWVRWWVKNPVTDLLNS